MSRCAAWGCLAVVVLLLGLWSVRLGRRLLPQMSVPNTMQEGRKKADDDRNTSLATVHLFLSFDCPISNSFVPELKRTWELFAPRGVEFVGIVPARGTTEADLARFRREYELPFSLQTDPGHRCGRRLGATHTPQAVVVSARGRTLYSGRIDDRYADLGEQRLAPSRRDLREVLSRIVAGEAVQTRWTKPVGCVIERGEVASTGEVTFTRDVAPILFRHCLRCHRPGEAAPFTLRTWEDARSHAEQIRLVVERRLMPPWKAVPGHGEFANTRRLSEHEIRTIGEWVEQGTPRGDPEHLPPEPEFAEGWQLGEPDLVLEMPEPFEVPADGPDVYRHFVIPTGLLENQMVSAAEFRPGDARVVHHATLYLDTTGEGRQRDAADPGQGYGGLTPGFVTSGSLGGWGPGGLPRRLPPGMGRPLPAGSDLVVQVHYHPIGKATRDRSRIGLYFTREEVTHAVTEFLVANVDLEIPAGAKDFRHVADYTLPVDTLLLDATPHMHLLGRACRAVAQLPDGTRRPLIRVDDYDFDWQDHYVYLQPVRLPAGTRIEVEFRYDNSSANPRNPHVPPRTVSWGDYSDDEMGICYFQATAETLEETVTLANDASAHFRALWDRYQQRKGAESADATERRPR